MIAFIVSYIYQVYHNNTLIQYSKSPFSDKIIQERCAIFHLQIIFRPQRFSLRNVEDLPILFIHEFVEHSSACLTGPVVVCAVIAIGVVADALPLLKSGGTLNHLLLKGSVLKLIVSEPLFFLFSGD